jgi:hypothetical protein
MNEDEYKSLFLTVAKWEHENKHNKLYNSKEMEARIKKLIQGSVKPEE